ncbi:MAG: tRNA dihydrouridine synthase DusB [Desulfuromonas sp.]|nr:MAG: tRNA dihydrouridine synthase DusB [Desulfuromonas sp.]
MISINRLKLDGPIVLAPMAGISDLPYRLTMKQFGASLVFTEMVSANGLIRNGQGSLDLLQSDPRERPLGIQLFGGEPDVMATAAKRVAPFGDLIDINFGCPVNKVVRGGAGSALLREPMRIRDILKAMRKAVDLPLTIKIRSGWDSSSVNFIEIGRIAEAEGVDAITLHPRTRSQGFGGEADWRQIAELKQGVTIPVLGSGDLFQADDIMAMLNQTGCDAVMIGRGGYGNPWLVRQGMQLLRGEPVTDPSPQEKLAVAREHLQRHLALRGERKALFEMRKHLCWYARSFPGAGEFRRRVNSSRSVRELSELLTDFLTEAAETVSS